MVRNMLVWCWRLSLVLTLAISAAAPAEESASQPKHPDSSQWPELFARDLSNAIFPAGVWAFQDDVLTATEDQCIWTKEQYANFILDLEFKNSEGTNSGVIVYCSDIKNWIPNSVEIQIADDFAEKWAKAPATWHCGAIFGHVAPKKSVVKKPGEWNRMTITCRCASHSGWRPEFARQSFGLHRS